MDSLPTISITDAYKALLDPEFISLLWKPWTPLAALRKSRIGGERFTICEKLGGGESKTVYSVDFQGESYAFAIPKKWERKNFPKNWKNYTLEEAVVERKLRDAGLIVNDYCEIVPLELQGVTFPILAMKRHQDHDFPIHLGLIGNPKIRLDLDDREEIQSSLQGVIGDLRIMAEENVEMDLDMFGFAFVDSQVRLFLYDLCGSPFFQGRNDVNDGIVSVVHNFINHYRKSKIRFIPSSIYSETVDYVRSQVFD